MFSTFLQKEICGNIFTYDEKIFLSFGETTTVNLFLLSGLSSISIIMAVAFCYHSFCWLILKTFCRKTQTTTDVNVKLLHLRYTFLNLKWNLYRTPNCSSHFIFLLVKSLNVWIIFFWDFQNFQLHSENKNHNCIKICGCSKFSDQSFVGNVYCLKFFEFYVIRLSLMMISNKAKTVIILEGK